MRDYRNISERSYNRPAEIKQQRQIFGGGSEIKSLLYILIALNVAIFGFMIGMFVSYVFF